jgi:hypothetical protein
MPRNRPLLIILGVLAALLVIALIVYVRAHTRQVLVVTAETLALQSFPTGPGGGTAPNPVVRVITPGKPYQALEVRHREEVEAVKILVAPGVIGWVIIGPAAHLEPSR